MRWTYTTLYTILLLIPMTVWAGCLDDGGITSGEIAAIRFTNETVETWKSDPHAFHTNIVGTDVELTTRVQYIQDNGRVELYVGDWAWNNNLQCVVNDNSALTGIRKKTISVRGTVHSVVDDYDLASRAHRVILSPCQIIEVVN